MKIILLLLPCLGRMSSTQHNERTYSYYDLFAYNFFGKWSRSTFTICIHVYQLKWSVFCAPRPCQNDNCSPQFKVVNRKDCMKSIEICFWRPFLVITVCVVLISIEKYCHIGFISSTLAIFHGIGLKWVGNIHIRYIGWWIYIFIKIKNKIEKKLKINMKNHLYFMPTCYLYMQRINNHHVYQPFNGIYLKKKTKKEEKIDAISSAIYFSIDLWICMCCDFVISSSLLVLCIFFYCKLYV